METYFSPNDPRFIAETDSESIQNAVDAASKSEFVRTVRIPKLCDRTGKAEWIIEKAILLPSDITVLLDDCHLILKEGIYDNIFRNKNMYNEQLLNDEGEQHGIRIVGFGDAVLDGGKGNDLREATSEKDGRPHVRFNNFILLNNVQNIVLENFKCINMRWWAINLIACRKGKISDIRFYNGTRIPNQDGIDLRIGCHEFIIENITGQTGDDVVAMTALPLCSDKNFLPKGRLPDIHDITVRNIRAHTNETLVAMRNCDGAKLYRISVENVMVTEGDYDNWAAVRVGENNYFVKRPPIMGETYDIKINGVYGLQKGTVYLGGCIKNVHISNVFAGGKTLYAISTYLPTIVFPENGCKITGGASLENVVIDNVFYEGTAEYSKDGWVNDVNDDFSGCALDFRCMRETDTLKNVVFRNIFARDGAEIARVHDGFELEIR